MSYELKKECYLSPTPAGAYYCMSGNEKEISRKILQSLLLLPSTQLINNETLEGMFSVPLDTSLQTLHHLEKLGWIEQRSTREIVPEGKLESILPDILTDLSGENKALLADSEGFYLSSAGYLHESAEEISALSADLVSLYERHKGLLKSNLKLASKNWGLLDAAGYSQLGFWPLQVGSEIFSLVISGQPRFQQQNYLRLAWILHTRYGNKSTDELWSKTGEMSA